MYKKKYKRNGLDENEEFLQRLLSVRENILINLKNLKLNEIDGCQLESVQLI